MWVRLQIREQDTQHNTQQERTQPTNPNTHMHRGNLYIRNISKNIRQQFPSLIILTPDDDYIGRNI
jgi:hypothetical protein